METPDTTPQFNAVPPDKEVINLIKLFFHIAMFMVAAFVTLEFGLMREETYTLRIEEQLVPSVGGPSLYTLSDGKYQGCLDARVGERVIFVHKRGYVTNLLWNVEPHDEYKCN